VIVQINDMPGGPPSFNIPVKITYGGSSQVTNTNTAGRATFLDIPFGNITLRITYGSPDMYHYYNLSFLQNQTFTYYLNEM